MTSQVNARGTAAPRELTLTRVFDAPRVLVWKAWTDPAHLRQWWCPRGFTNPVCEVDLRPGGTLRLVMRGPAGTPFSGDMPMTGEYREIVEPERLVFVTRILPDDAGNPQLEVHHTVTFIEQAGRTTLTMQATVVTASAQADGPLSGMREGWSQSLDKLAEHLPTMR